MLLILLFAPILTNARASPPDILFILADDLGWADTGPYGNELFETPHLDQLASEGMRFTQAYSPAPICSAARAAILTGNSTARNRFEFVVKAKVDYQPVEAPLRAPEYTVDLALDATTLPEVLAATGRPTAFFGKWHLNAHYEGYLGWSPTHGPKQQGFGSAIEDFGSHPYSYWPRKELRQFDETIEKGSVPPDSVTRHAIEFLEQDHENPFFLMVSHFYVHDPNHTRLRWLHDHYLEQLPEETYNRNELAHYGAMVTTLDHHVGELLAALEKSGKRDNTLVVFTSDNGGHPNYAGNAPLRGSKWNLYEGGIRVPMIVRWPEVVPPGSVCETPVWSADLFPTFAGIAGADASTAKDGRSLLPLLKDPGDDFPLRDLVWHFPYYHPEKGYDDAPETIGVNDGKTSKTKPHSAIRRGNWKLIHFYEDDRSELYDLSGAPGTADQDSESNNVYPLYEQTGNELRERLRNYLRDVDARMPTSN